MKKSKKLMALLLILVLVVCSIPSAAFANDEGTSKMTEELDACFSIKGVHIYQDMDIVDSEDDFAYELIVRNLSTVNGKVELDADIIDTVQNEYSLQATALLYQTEVIPLQGRGGYTALTQDSNMNVLNFALVERACGFLLYPVHETYDGKSVLTIVVEVPGLEKTIYFEGLLPEDFQINQGTATKAVSKADNLTAKRRIATLEEEYSAEYSEREVVQAAESWMMRISDDSEDQSVDIEEDNVSVYEKSEIDLSKKTAPARHDPSRVPFDVFKKVGNWKSTNNPDYPGIGYFAQTYSQSPGVSSNFIDLISWQYLYNDAGTITASTTTSSKGNGKSMIKIIDHGLYHYNSTNGQITKYSTQTDFRLKNAAIAVGLQNYPQIFTEGTPTNKLNKGVWDVDWKFFAGYVSKSLTTAANILDKVSIYKEEKFGQRSYIFSDTIAKQEQDYGYLVRTVKMSSGEAYFRYIGDHMTMNYTVCQPKDKTSTKGTKTISTRFYFEVYTFNGATHSKRFSVNETRTSTYKIQ